MCFFCNNSYCNTMNIKGGYVIYGDERARMYVNRGEKQREYIGPKSKHNILNIQ